MAHNPKIVVNGFTFLLNVGLGAADGVVIRPDDNNVDDPEFTKALAWLLKHHKGVDAACSLDEMSAYYMQPDAFDDFKTNVPDEVLDRHLAEYELAMTTDEFFPVIDRVHRFAALLSDIKQSRATQTRRKREAKANYEAKAKGYVYLVQSPTGAYKIGRTKNPNDRMRTFNVKLPFEVEYVCVIRTNDMIALEDQLHEEFKDKHINGEWFNLSPEDVEYIKDLAE